MSLEVVRGHKQLAFTRLRSLLNRYIALKDVPNVKLYTDKLEVAFAVYEEAHESRVANSHAYGVILTHLTCYSRTHAIDKFTHAFKKDHTHTHAI